MSDGNGCEDHLDEESSLAQRQAALRALAQEQASAASPPLTPPAASPGVAQLRMRRGGTRRWIISALSVLAVVAVIVVVVVNILGASRPGASIKPMLRINPQGDGLNCVSQIAWSPDGKEIAALGNFKDCSGSESDTQTGAVFIYDGATGKVIERERTDNLIFRDKTIAHLIASQTNASSPATMLTYLSLTWTPDGQSLLLYFNLFMTTGGAGQADYSGSGLLRLRMGQAGSSSVWLDHYSGMQSGDTERWDLTTGKSVQSPQPQATVAYRWGSDGALLPASSSSGGAIGSAVGGKDFTIWQNGTLSFPSVQSSPNAPPTVSAHDIGWNANITPISPDGRYYYTYFPIGGDLTPPSTVFIQPGAPKFKPHDKALLALALKMTSDASASQPPSLLVTYRPDGRLLAVAEFNGAAAGNVTPATFTVSIYNTATGALVKRLTPNFTDLQSGSVGQETLAWSPDGSRLLLADNAYGAITVWGPGALPV